MSLKPLPQMIESAWLYELDTRKPRLVLGHVALERTWDGWFDLRLYAARRPEERLTLRYEDEEQARVDLDVVYANCAGLGEWKRKRHEDRYTGPAARTVETVMVLLSQRPDRDGNLWRVEVKGSGTVLVYRRVGRSVAQAAERFPRSMDQLAVWLDRVGLEMDDLERQGS